MIDAFKEERTILKKYRKIQTEVFKEETSEYLTEIQENTVKK